MILRIIIYIYYLLAFIFSPVYFIFFVIRILNGKEDISRILERFGIAPKGLKLGTNIIWVHGASIGESLAALTLVKAMEADEIIIQRKNLLYGSDSHNNEKDTIQFLITTGTMSSSEVLKNKLPKNVIHQFFPIDNIIFIRHFLGFWKPKISIFIESEIWPGIIYEASKNSSLLLFNARLSDKSFWWWQKFSFFFKRLLARFKEIIVQSDEDLKKLQTFIKGKVINLGNIKFANKKLDINKQDSEELIDIFKGKKVVLFASTHFSDEKVILKTIKPIKKIFPDSYFIIVLRHPSRVHTVEKFCTKLNLTFKVRSNKKSTPNLKNDLYIVDTFDELGLFYNIAHITFVGGSFDNGGHSPLEAAHFNNLIMFGPNMENCQDIANLMISNKAAIQIIDEEQLQNLLEYFLNDENSKLADIYKQNALNFVSNYQQVIRNYLAIVIKYI